MLIKKVAATAAEVNCEYCNLWKKYDTDEYNEMIKDIPSSPGWNTKELVRLLKMLYMDKISIGQFKERLKAAGMDYNKVEHCCGCAGCYRSRTHKCPDFGSEGHDCKLIDPKYCEICKQKAEIGYPMTDKNDKIVYMFWACEKHANDPKLEDMLRKGDSYDDILNDFVPLVDK